MPETGCGRRVNMAIRWQTASQRVGSNYIRCKGSPGLSPSKRMTAGLIILVLVAIGVGCAWLVGNIAAAPARAVIGPPPPDFALEPVTFNSGSGSKLSGWFGPGRHGAGSVILMHGIKANRLEMLDRARFLNAAGFSVLLFDFQAHGESTGEYISFGHLEALDARAAFDFLRAKTPAERIGLIGVSLGGAAAILSEPVIDADAMVLEAVFASFKQATENRVALYLGRSATWLAHPLIWQAKARLGFDPQGLNPAGQINRIRAPLLLIAGDADAHATLAEMELIYARANDPKELWIVPGARHVDFHRHAKVEYERRVLAFLSKNLARRR